MKIILTKVNRKKYEIILSKNGKRIKKIGEVENGSVVRVKYDEDLLSYSMKHGYKLTNRLVKLLAF